jgi:hypothetical protein
MIGDGFGGSPVIAAAIAFTVIDAVANAGAEPVIDQRTDHLAG